jgi:hypothetical protein
MLINHNSNDKQKKIIVERFAITKNEKLLVKYHK